MIVSGSVCLPRFKHLAAFPSGGRHRSAHALAGETYRCWCFAQNDGIFERFVDCLMFEISGMNGKDTGS